MGGDLLSSSSRALLSYASLSGSYCSCDCLWHLANCSDDRLHGGKGLNESKRQPLIHLRRLKERCGTVALYA